jgi:glycine reductase
MDERNLQSDREFKTHRSPVLSDSDNSILNGVRIHGKEEDKMADRTLRVVHYLNQFFGGIGGEDKAHAEPQMKIGPIGPGKAVQGAFGDQGKVVATIICGDNYFAERIEDATTEVINLIKSQEPDVVIAGPAFDAGRYGIACGAVCKRAQSQLGIPAVTGMFVENPGVDLFRKDVYIIETENSARRMSDVISKMVNIACRLVAKEKIGKPSLEGYFARGYLHNEVSDRIGAERVVSMLLAKLRGEPFQSEVPPPRYDRVKPASGLKDLHVATIALVTDGGLVPKGNPDKIQAREATRFGSYGFKETDGLNPDDYEVNHVGYSPVFVLQDPHRLVPVDVMLDLEREGVIGKLLKKFYSTAGAVCVVENIRKMGRAIAKELKEEGVSGVILTST